MSIYGSHSRHWATVGQRFATDAVLVFASFYAAAVIRFSHWQPVQFGWYLPSVFMCALLLPSLIYIQGLYSEESMHQSRLKRVLQLLGAFAVTVFFVLAYGSLNFSARIGRGVFAVAGLMMAGSVWAHHMAILLQARKKRLHIAFLAGDAEDEAEALRLAACGKPHIAFAGFITAGGFQPHPSARLPVLGSLERAAEEGVTRQFDCLVCRTARAGSPGVAAALRNLRYRGAHVMTMVDAFEDLFHLVPLELIDDDWLMHVSAMPGYFYVRKLKRASDVAAAVLLLLLLGPICLAAMLLIRVSSPGPVIFRQERSGRFGRRFTVLKLRTMRLDAETDGPQWAQTNDPRATVLGRFLRKYRIDEIPQLINVLRGEMSFVGPRPERPEFVAELSESIPFYAERLMLQPGITGWAQVRYGYGATIEDARRKLEYDLYYMKHMSVFLDAFILLDTVRTIIRGVRFSGEQPWREPAEAAKAKAEAQPAVL